MFWSTILATTIFGLAIGQNYTERVILPDGQWNEFSFGQVGEPPFLNLRFTIGLMSGMIGAQGGNHPDVRKCYLEITDAFCPGDRFEAIELGPDGVARNILTTPEVGYNPQVAQDICDGFPVQCANSTSNPEVAYHDSIWSNGRVLMAAGNHSVIIKSINSPYCSGAGFVRVRCSGQPMPPYPPYPPHPPLPPPPHPPLLCKYSEGGFRMVMKPVQGP